MKTLELPTTDWSAARLRTWFEQRGLSVDSEALANGGPAAVANPGGLWPTAMVQVRWVRIGPCRALRAHGTVYRRLHAYFIEVRRDGGSWFLSLRRDPSLIRTMLGWGVGGTLVLAWPFAAMMTATGTAPAWLEPWWRMALLKLALGGVALLPSLLILQWLRDGRKSRAAYEELLRELGAELAGAGGSSDEHRGE